MKANQWYRVRIRVTKDRIAAWIDQDKVVDLDTDGKQISTRIESAATQPFGIATYRTTGAIRDIKVRMLTEDDKKQKE